MKNPTKEKVLSEIFNSDYQGILEEKENKISNLTEQEVKMLNYLRDSLDGLMGKANYGKEYIIFQKALLRKIIENNRGNIQQ